MTSSGGLTCATCGAPLGAADLNRPSCPYCGSLHPHVARAAQKVEEVKQAMALGPGGVPVVLQGMLGPSGPAPPPGGFPANAPQPGPSPFLAPGYPAPLAQKVHRTARNIVLLVALGSLGMVLLTAAVVVLVVVLG